MLASRVEGKRVEGEKGLRLQLLVMDCSVEGGKSSLLTLGGSFDARNQREMLLPADLIY
jgi:hypothetical protein